MGRVNPLPGLMGFFTLLHGLGAAGMGSHVPSKLGGGSPGEAFLVTT